MRAAMVGLVLLLAGCFVDGTPYEPCYAVTLHVTLDSATVADSVFVADSVSHSDCP